MQPFKRQTHCGVNFGLCNDNADHSVRLQDIKINRKRFGGLQCVALGGIGEVIDAQNLPRQQRPRYVVPAFGLDGKDLCIGARQR